MPRRLDALALAIMEQCDETGESSHDEKKFRRTEFIPFLGPEGNATKLAIRLTTRKNFVERNSFRFSARRAMRRNRRFVSQRRKSFQP